MTRELAVTAAMMLVAGCSESRGPGDAEPTGPGQPASVPAGPPSFTSDIEAMRGDASALNAPDATADDGGSAPSSLDAAAGGGTPSSAPPSVSTNTNLLPSDPGCPEAAPEPGSECEVEIGYWRSCAWAEATGITRCACVAPEDTPPDAVLSWNCDPGVSGEGPPIGTCPSAMPQHRSACHRAGGKCTYVDGGLRMCICDSDLTWNCEYDWTD